MERAAKAPKRSGCPQPVRLLPPIRQVAAPTPSGYFPQAVRMEVHDSRISAALRVLNQNLLNQKSLRCMAAVFLRYILGRRSGTHQS